MYAMNYIISILRLWWGLCASLKCRLVFTLETELLKYGWQNPRSGLVVRHSPLNWERKGLTLLLSSPKFLLIKKKLLKYH